MALALPKADSSPALVLVNAGISIYSYKETAIKINLAQGTTAADTST